MLGGCGIDGEVTYPITSLGGEVTIDGNTVEEGIVSFQSLDPKNGHFADTRIVRGRYIAEKVPLGKNLVVISAFKVAGLKIAGAGQPLPETGNLTPPQYLDVSSKTSRVDFKLTQVKAEPRPDPSGSEGPFKVSQEETEPRPDPSGISGDSPEKPSP